LTFCDTTEGIGASFPTHGKKERQIDEWMDRQMWRLK